MYRDFEIDIGEPQYGKFFAFQYIHKDYDGDEDNRCGYEESVEACKDWIDDYWSDHPAHAPYDAEELALQARDYLGNCEL